jgi:hypothetical protein
LNKYEIKGHFLIDLINVISHYEALKKLIVVKINETGLLYYHSEFSINDEFYFDFFGPEPLENSVDLTDITQEFFSRYVEVMYHTLNGIIDFLIDLKNILLTLPSSDLPLKQNVPLSPDESTLDNPLKYFNHLIYNFGLRTFKENFFPSMSTPEDITDWISDIDKDNKSYTYLDYGPDGEVQDVVVNLSDSLHSRLLTEYYISNNFIDLKIKEFQSDSLKVSSILDLHISNCIDLLNKVNQNEQYARYPMVAKCLKKIANTMIEKYSTFINFELCHKIDPVKYAKPIPEKLTWNGDRETFVKLFYDHVIKHNITLNNSDAYEPVYEKLASFFNIKPKSNKLGRPPKDINESGFIKESSVIANFKAAGNSIKKPK